MKPEHFLEKLRDIRLLATDVDGVLTDGGLYYTEDGQELKRFNVKDGQGIKQVLATGIPIAIISASASKATHHRAQKLGVDLVYTGVNDKLTCLVEVSKNLGLSLKDVAYVGDDINDLPVLENVGIPLTVSDGIEAAKALSYYTTKCKGGQGAIREICDLLLEVRKNDE